MEILIVNTHCGIVSLTIIVAHRIETIIQANQILVMQDGKLIDQGKHDQLLERCATYQEFIDQVRGNVWLFLICERLKVLYLKIN